MFSDFSTVAFISTRVGAHFAPIKSLPPIKYRICLASGAVSNASCIVSPFAHWTEVVPPEPSFRAVAPQNEAQ